jgi:ferritin-like metal-binding protein YciE
MKTRQQKHTNEKAGMNTALSDTFISELRDIYDAEQQLIKALPKMSKAAENEELQEAFENHLEETREHVERLEEVFALFDEEASGKKCKGIQGLIQECEERIKEGYGDAALICSAQKVEHYEMASYGSLAAWASLLGKTDAADLLQATLAEETQTDEKLTDIAETSANVEEAEQEEDTEKDEGK